MEFFVTTRNLERAIRQAISMLRYLPVVKDGEEVMVLGEADPSILPVNPLVQKMKGE
jgi:hypothetical protein